MQISHVDCWSHRDGLVQLVLADGARQTIGRLPTSVGMFGRERLVGNLLDQYRPTNLEHPARDGLVPVLTRAHGFVFVDPSLVSPDAERESNHTWFGVAVLQATGERLLLADLDGEPFATAAAAQAAAKRALGHNAQRRTGRTEPQFPTAAADR